MSVQFKSIFRSILILAAVSLCWLPVFSQQASGEASAVASAAHKTLASLDIVKHSGYIHPDALEDLKGLIWPALSSTIAADTNAAQSPLVQILGLELTEGKLVDMSARQLYINLLGMTFSQSPELAKTLSDAVYTVVGEVAEGDDQVHVLYRISSASQPEAMSRMEVTSLRMSDSGWKLGLPPEVASIAAGIARMLTQQEETDRG